MPLKPVYFVAGFGNSPIISQINNYSLYPECPKITKITIQSNTIYNKSFLSIYPDCASKLLRVKQNITTKKVEQLAGIKTESTPIGYSSIHSKIFGLFINSIIKMGYRDNINLFGVGYNYYLHPVTSYNAYNSLKNHIEQIYSVTKEKSILITYDQGTSFASIFLSNYSQFKWVKQYIDSVIFIEPTFAGLPLFPELYNQKIEPFIPTEEVKKSIMRMPGLHIRMPNYAIYSNISIKNKLTNKIDLIDPSRVFEYLKENGKVDDESESIFKAEVEKFLKVPVPEPPIESLIIYNDKNEYSQISSEYACSHWNSVNCHKFESSTEIIQNKKASEIIKDFIKKRNKKLQQKIESISAVETVTYTELFGNYSNDDYVNLRKIPSSKFKYSGPKGMIDYPLSNAFDENSDTLYLSSIANSASFNNTVYINFTEKVKLEAFIYEPGYNTDGGNRNFQGCPTKLCIYTSIGDDQFSLVTIFEGTPTFSMTKILFLFPEIIECEKLKIEFVDLTVQTFIGDSKKPIICGLHFIQYFKTAFLTGASDKFANDDYIQLNKISSFTYNENEGINGHTLSNAFDNNISSFYISSNSNSDTILINFLEKVSLEAMIYEPKYFDVDSTRVFQGFPTLVRVFISIENGDFLLNNIFLGTPVYPWTRIQLVFPEIIECDKIKLEFTGITNQTIIGDSKNAVICEFLFIHPQIEATKSMSLLPTPTDMPILTPTPIHTVEACKVGSHCEYEGSENNSVLVVIETSNFSRVENNENGGAVYVKNAGLTCNDITFDGCNSKQGGGGGLFIKNDIEQASEISIKNVSFANCRANFGGAAFIESTSIQIGVNIIDCTFTSCQSMADGFSSFTGGNGLYITAKKCFINECHFLKNIGESQLKIFNDFETVNSEYLDNEYQASNRIRCCTFDIDKNSKCSLFYYGGVKGVSCRAISCIFIGQLNHGNYHINGKVELKYSPKIFIDMCKFSSDESKSFNDENDFTSVVYQNQVFNYNSDEKIKDIDILSYSMILLAVVIAVVIIIFLKKQVDRVNAVYDPYSSSNVQMEL